MWIQFNQAEIKNNAKYRMKPICIDNRSKTKRVEGCRRQNMSDITWQPDEHSRTNLQIDSLNSSYLFLTGCGTGRGGLQSLNQSKVNALMKLKLLNQCHGFIIQKSEGGEIFRLQNCSILHQAFYFVEVFIKE